MLATEENPRLSSGFSTRHHSMTSRLFELTRLGPCLEQNRTLSADCNSGFSTLHHSMTSRLFELMRLGALLAMEQNP